MIEFIKDYPVVFLKEEKCLVAAELHLGIEYEILKNGFYVTSQFKKFFDHFKRLIQKTEAKKLILVGDVKHEVPGLNPREIKELPKFFEKINEMVEVILTKGNHDAQIEDLIQNVKIHGARGFKFGKYGFFHGHAWPSTKLLKCKYWFIAHLHPCIEIKGKFGSKIFRRVWLKGFVNKKEVHKKFGKKVGKIKVIVLPAFNNLVGCANIKENLESKFFDFKNAEVYLLDGTYLGKVKQL
jgi:putative SbcD/Mre11-related phosphoesterase